MSNLKLLNFVFLLSFGVLAQTVSYRALEEPVVDKKRELLEEIKRLEKIDRSDFSKALERITKEISKYGENRKKECTGEYSSIEITENGETKKIKNKLSKEEKKLCLLELIKLRKKIAESLFNVRRKWLLQQHRQQLKTLDDLRAQTIKELEIMAGKLK